MSNVLFVCIQNAGRSQMAEAFFNQELDRWKAVIDRAGIKLQRQPFRVIASPRVSPSASPRINSAKQSRSTRACVCGARLLRTGFTPQ